MNFLLIINVAFTVVSIILSILSISTLGNIRNLGIGKSFWVPMVMSATFFLSGSIIGIINEFSTYSGFSLILLSTFNANEIIQVSWLVALGLLTCGTYSYSKKVKAIRNKPTIETDEKELTLMDKQVQEALKKVEKLKKQIKSKN